MAFAKGALTEEQRKRIEENRQRALNRIQRKQHGDNSLAANVSLKEGPKDGSVKQTTSLSQIISGADHKRARVELTGEQKKRIEENRRRALELKLERERNNRDATSNSEKAHIPEHAKQALKDNKTKNGPQGLRPSINRKEYIEFDFATMKDSRGGFIEDESGSGGNESGTDSKNESKTLEEWKEQQKKNQHIVRDLAPPVDIAAAPKCFECGSLEIDPNLYSNFGHVRVCRPCAKAKPEKYALLTKTECREDYLLTDPELRDVELLPRIEKPNPHGFSRMQLFLRFQVEQFAWKKWGSAEKLDEEWERREKARLDRRDKKYNEKLKEMRKKTRAEEYTRKLRNGQNLGERHSHQWSQAIAMPGNANMVKRRCIDCGLETEELVI
ncbi:DNA repair protein rad14 [Meyerozyma guilliermondii]